MTKIIRRETRKRGLIGWVFEILFIVFNLFMLAWLVNYWGDVGSIVSNASSDAAKAGSKLGATLGTGFLVFFWAAGDVVLGFLTIMTRGKLTVIEERVEG